MTLRTTTKTVTFRRPFILGGFDEVLPAGAYKVETDEELLEGLSFPAYRRTLTVIHLHPRPGHPGLMQTLTIDPSELDAALKRDQAQIVSPFGAEFSEELSKARKRSRDNEGQPDERE
jgi:hypothetical protein